jgi:hypothetical protein
MPHITQMKSSRFLKVIDVDPEITVTIDRLALETVDEDRGEQKWCLFTRELDKPLVCNWTNLQLLAKACGSENSDDWPGKRVILWNDESVQFKGQVTGGIRVRKVPQPKVAPKPVAVSDADFDDDLPGWGDEGEAA